MINHIGFTGTREQVTEAQKKTLINVFDELRQDGAGWLHTGDCIGADVVAVTIWSEMGGFNYGHPPINVKLRAGCKFHNIMPPLPYLQRNRAIVDACDLLVAVPHQSKEIDRSGTWQTIRYARAVHKPRIIIYPNGEEAVEACEPLLL
jgi:hypothetical protein